LEISEGPQLTVEKNPVSAMQHRGISRRRNPESADHRNKITIMPKTLDSQLKLLAMVGHQRMIGNYTFDVPSPVIQVMYQVIGRKRRINPWLQGRISQCQKEKQR
jgi:hypothetical protein